jgi:hypothetical protein
MRRSQIASAYADAIREELVNRWRNSMTLDELVAAIEARVWCERCEHRRHRAMCTDFGQRHRCRCLHGAVAS